MTADEAVAVAQWRAEWTDLTADPSPQRDAHWQALHQGVTLADAHAFLEREDARHKRTVRHDRSAS